MTDTELPHQPETFPLWREIQDTRTRTRLGGLYYLLAWTIAWAFSATPGEHLLLGLGGTLLFGALLVARLRHCPGAAATQAQLKRWLDTHWGLILLTGLAWGLAHAYMILTPDYRDARIIGTLSTVAFGTAMAFNFAMRRAWAILALMLLYLPGLAAMLLAPERLTAELVTLAFYLSYLLLALNRSHREYQGTLNLEMELLLQRQRLDALSRTDGLTLLGNRHQFNNLFPAMVAHAAREGSPLSLVLLDIDFFKRINDEYGHAAGDRCLEQFAERMRQVFRRDSDALLRLGGEEFGVLMPGTTREQAVQLGESFRAALAREGLTYDGHTLPMTTSLGVGCFDPQRDASAEAFFKRVDDALYRAKSHGRDRVETA